MKSIIFIFTLLCYSILMPQFYNNEQFNPKIKWKYIENENFKIVFPKEIKFDAFRVLSLMEKNYNKEYNFKNSKKFTIFLTNSGIQSNGFVRLAPAKGEFFSTPPQTNLTGNTEWYNTLSIHEGTHIEQFEKLNRGFTKLGDFFFGDIIRMGLSISALPHWFWEGEAVYNETIYSNGGRGRSPIFSMGTKAVLLNNKNYGYTKSYLSSYKDYVPNVYKLGYFLTTYLKNNYPKEIVNKILNNSSSYSFYPLIFSCSLKKYTGMTTKKLYTKVMKELKDSWEKEKDELKFTKTKIINKTNNNIWTNYYSPKFSSQEDIIVQKYGLDDSLALVKINKNGKETKIVNLKTVDGGLNAISIKNNIATWSEPVKDIRWGKSSYVEIVCYDIKNKRKQRITKKSRCLSPDLSNDGKLISAIKFSKKRKTSIVIIDKSKRKIINEFPAPNNSYLLNSSWGEKGKKIVMVRQDKLGKNCITLLECQTGTFKDITKPDYEVLSNPIIFNNYILYSSSYSGRNNIFATKIKTGETFMITSSKFGAFTPFVSKNKKIIIYSDYSFKGMNIVEIPLDEKSWIPLKNVKVIKNYYFAKNIKNKKKMEKSNGVKEYKVKDYSKIKDFIDFHSRLLLLDPVKPALEFYSSNKLNTTFITFGLDYNTNEKKASIYTDIIYAGFFPIFKFGLTKQGRSLTNEYETEWSEKSADFSIILPLNLSRGVFTTKLNIETNLSFTNIKNIHRPKQELIKNGNIVTTNYKISFVNYKDFSKRSIFSRLYQSLNIEYDHTPFETVYQGKRFFIESSLGLGGFFKNNNIIFSTSYENQNTKNFVFSSKTKISRGYNFLYHNKFLSVKTNYSFPIAYPDLPIGDIFYIKRLRGNLFYDYTKGYNKNEKKSFQSYGVEIITDMNFFSLPAEFQLGGRISYKLEQKSFSYEIMFMGINF